MVNIEPCKCTEHRVTQEINETVVECRGLGDVEDLFSVAKKMKNVAVNVFSLFDSYIGNLSGRLFQDTRINQIQIYDTPLSISDWSSLFAGLESYLTELSMRRCGLTDEHRYSTLQFLSVLHTLDLSHNDITKVAAAWFKIPPRKLAQVYLKGNQIVHVEDEAFANLINLRVLDLSENKITHLKRETLPRPASHLAFLYLSYNELETLPDDLFAEMPILHHLYLDHNHLTVLPEKLLESLWKNYLSRVDVLGNDIICDTSLCWMAFYDSDFLMGSCAEPDELRGRRLKTLWPWHLNCDNKLYKGDTHLSYRATL